MAALDWVLKNIAAFGGDPKNVTIGGESAGSVAVNAQMASPLAIGKFQRVIAESGTVFSNGNGPGRTQSLAVTEAAGAKYAASIGADSLAACCARFPRTNCCGHGGAGGEAGLVSRGARTWTDIS